MNKVFYPLFFFILFSSCASLKKKNVPEHDANYIHSFHEGIRLRMDGQIQEAISHFNKCLAIDEKDDAVHFALAQIYLEDKKLNQAAIHTKRASEIDPKNRHYQSELAFMYVDLKQYKSAIPIFEKLLKSAPLNQSYYAGEAECYAQLGDTKKGIELLNRMENNLGASPGISIEKFKLLVSSKRDEEAIQILKEAKKKFDNEPLIIANLVDYYLQHQRFQEGFELLKELVIADPSNGMALLMLGDMQMQAGDIQNGIKNLKAAVKTDGPSIDQKMNILIALQGQETMDPEMENLVKYMCAKYPKEAKSHSIAGDYYFKANQISQAVQAYKAAVQCDPNVYPIWKQIMLLEYQYQQFDSLVLDAKKCLSFFPTQPLAYFIHGAALNQKKEFNLALEALETGIEFVVNDADLKAEFYGQMGEANFGLKNPKKGVESYNSAIKLAPTNAFIKNNYAYQLALNEMDFPLALQLINAILSDFPFENKYIDTKGFIEFQLGHFNEAKNLFEQACGQKESKEARCVEHIGDALFMLGKKDEALFYWLRAKELGSTNKSLDEKITQKKYAKPSY